MSILKISQKDYFKQNNFITPMKKSIVVILAVLLSICVSNAQETSIDYYTSAYNANQKGDYDTARACLIKCLEDKDLDSTTKDLAEALFARLDVFEVVSGEKWRVPPGGDYREFNVNSVSDWTCKSLPGWCKVEEKNSNYVKIWCDPNPKHVSRGSVIIFENKNGKSVEVEIEQDMGDEAKGKVYFRTQPYNAYVEVEDGTSGYSSSPLQLRAGEHKIVISKDGYVTKDTTLVIMEVSNQPLVVSVNLKPKFSMLKPIILDENGNPWLTSDLSKIKFTIGRTEVNISDLVNCHSFDDRTSIEYLKLYKEGVIPINPQKYTIEVSAEGYETYKKIIQPMQGEEFLLEVPMNSVVGKLKIVKGLGADGAVLTIPQLYRTAKVGETIELKEGTYDIFVNKEGYQWANNIHQVTIKEGITSEYVVDMIRLVKMYVSTTSGGEKIYLNENRIIGERHFLQEGEEYRLDVKKDGLWHFVKDFTVTPKDTIFDFRNLHLEKAHTLNLKTDETNLKIELKRKGDLSNCDYAENQVLSGKRGEVTSFKIPNGKYEVVLKRDNVKSRSILNNHELAYKGVINFKDTLKTKNLRTWMIPKLGAINILGLEYDMLYKSEIAGGKIPIPLKLKLLEFPIVKGLSTSLSKTSLIYTYGRSDFPNNLPLYTYTPALFAFSGPLMNYDFRVGGGFCQWGDVSALLSYTYYLQFEQLAKKWTKDSYSGTFNHFEGHDLFIGLELSSRLSVFTGYLCAGFQYLKGNRCYSFYDYKSSRSVAELIDMNQGSFVLKVGLNFGFRSVKGQNIWRVF